METSKTQELSKNNMENSIKAIEQKLNYTFKNKKLLENALTHPSSSSSSTIESTSYQRLEFLGDAVLGLVVANAAFLGYPTVDEGILTLLRSINTSTLNLARVAVRHRLYSYIRHNSLHFDSQVQAFVHATSESNETAVYGRAVKAPKVLADIVESLIGAVYLDCDYDLKSVWQVISGLLEPLITLETLPMHVVMMLSEFCRKQGKQFDIKHSQKIDKNICSIYVDGKLIATGTSDQKGIAQLKAAKQALEKLNKSVNDMDIEYQVNDDKYEIECAKQKLCELCAKQKWPKPIFRIEKEVGMPPNKKYVFTVEVEISDMKLLMSGDEKPKVKMAENSAASKMIRNLIESSYC